MTPLKGFLAISGSPFLGHAAMMGWLAPPLSTIILFGEKTVNGTKGQTGRFVDGKRKKRGAGLAHMGN
jgi:hypothetical protein